MAPPRSHRSWLADVTFVIGVLVVAGGLAGWLGLATGGLGLAAARFGGHRPAAAGALAALVYAGLATVLEVHPTPPVGPDYANDRPSAAIVAKIAGVLVVVATALAAREERADRPSGADGPAQEPIGKGDDA